MNLDRLFLGRAAQRVRRFHTMPTVEEQTVGAHTFGVLHLIMELTDYRASLDLVVAALHHDMQEAIVGDTPSPVLRRLPEFREAYKNAEKHIEDRYELGISLEPNEEWLLKAADRLELALFCLEDWSRGNRQALLMLERVTHYMETAETPPCTTPGYWLTNVTTLVAEIGDRHRDMKASGRITDYGI